MIDDDFKDETWVTRDGREILVGDMTENHVRNALRMLIRKARRVAVKRQIAQLYEDLPFPDEQFYERPDNHQHLADLRRRHGDAVRVERASVAGMDGGNVYVGDRKVGWFGGI